MKRNERETSGLGPGTGHISRGIIQVCGAAAAIFGLLALLGWIVRQPLLATFGSGKIPMAPSTALLFVLFGTAIFIYSRAPQSRLVYRAGIATGLAGASAAMLLFVLSSSGIHPEVEHMGLRIEGAMNGTPIGHMSPVTAFCFVLAGVSFLLLLTSSAGGRRRAEAGAGFALPIVITSTALMLAYFLGAPLLYGSGVIPPALTTSLAFLGLGISLLVFCARRAWPGEWSQAGDSRRAMYALILILCIFGLGIATAGRIRFHRFQEHYQVEVERELSTVADLKVGELTQWRKERLNDASLFFENDNFSERVRRFLENPDDAEARDRLRTWLDKLHAAGNYDRVYLLDTRGVERISAPDTPELAEKHLRQEVSETLRNGRVDILDFHRDSASDPIHLSVLTPLFDGSDAKRPLGVLVMRIDPTRYLYPLIARWPTPRQTAETLLVRREGNEVLFLNELRFESNAALNLRKPLTDAALPAANVASGREGVMKGIDYRGVPVIAALRIIPDSPWFMVARVDAAEVYAPLRVRLWAVVGLVVILFLCAVAAAGVVWQRNEKRHYRSLARARGALEQSEQTLRAIFENVRDGIVALDVAAGKFVSVNPAMCRMLGYSRDEMLGLGVKDIHPEEVFGEIEAVFESHVRGEVSLAGDVPVKRKDGSVFYADINSTPVELGGRACLLGVFRDVTDRKAAEERIDHLNRVLRAIRNVNQLIVREKDRDSLIQQACDRLTEHRSYASALIVLVDDAARAIAYRQAGVENGLRPLREQLDRGELPAICQEVRKRDGSILISDPKADCPGCPIVSSHTSTKSMCVGLAHENIFFGNLIVTMTQGSPTDAEEQDLFAEVAGDLAFSLHTMAAREDMRRSQAEKSALEEQLLQSQKMEAVGRLAGGVAHDFNNMLQTILGYTELLLEDFAPNHPSRENLEEIQNAAQRSADLTRQLLAFSRRQTISPKVLDLNDTIAGMLKILGRLIGEDIDLLWNPGWGLGPVKMDPTQIDQILANLVVNARDAVTGQGKVTIETGAAEFGAEYCANHVGFAEGKYVILAVSDDGVGMDREIQSHIFEPFFTTKPTGRGTGLGLATVYGIVKQNNGFINVYSEPGIGTTIRIYLPLHEMEPTAAEAIGKPAEKPVGTETVLLVEDEASLLRLGRRILEQLGYTVIASDAPETALRLAEEFEGEIHLLVTDVVMPQMSGQDLWRRLSGMRPGLKCLFMSGYTANAISHHGILDEGIHFLQKPFDVDVLARKIREVLEG